MFENYYFWEQKPILNNFFQGIIVNVNKISFYYDHK